MPDDEYRALRLYGHCRYRFRNLENRDRTRTVIVCAIADRITPRRPKLAEAVDVDVNHGAKRVAFRFRIAIPRWCAESGQLHVVRMERIMIDGHGSHTDMIIVRTNRHVLVFQHRIAAANDGNDVSRVFRIRTSRKAPGSRKHVLEVSAILTSGLETESP